jgi:ribosomal protein S18 acetylase RimI-like enzyme
LYILTFPLAERRSWAGLEYELDYEKRFCAHALVQNDKFVGLFNYWTFENFYYIEHVAVVPAMRGKQIGTEAMEIFMSQTKLPIILEVELPDNPVAIRRIHFYEKLGFSLVPHTYAQPPYDEEDEELIPMQLMCNDAAFAGDKFEVVKDTLYSEVYHFTIHN